jgi:DNA polymerase-3 subunit gamma/tau
MLTKEGANAFLKTLEEPPEWAVFILATTAPEALPPTILSRCQRYAFRRIAIPTMIARMREIADAEGIVIDDAALGAIAYRADGGLRDALTMLEQVASFANGPVDAVVVEAAFGQTGRAFARALRDVSLDGDAAEALRIIDDASDSGTDMTGLIRSTLAEFRHLLVARVNPDLLSRDLAEDDAQAARERAAATPQARIVRALRLLADALTAARNSGNARLELESVVLRFILQGEDPTLDAISARLAALEGGEPRPVVPPPPRREPPPPVPRPEPSAPRPEPAAVRVEAPPEPQPEAPPPGERPAATADPSPAANTGAVPPMELSLQKLRTLWQQIRTRAEEVKPSLNAPLSRATVEGLERDTIVLRIPVPPMAEVVKRELPALKRAIAAVTGRTLDVRVVSGASAPPPQTGVAEDGGEEPPDDLMRYALDTLPTDTREGSRTR